jgi:uncharacterized membrane protein
MESVARLLSSEALDAEVVSGVSYGFALIFYAPLVLVAAIFFVYCIFARRSVIRSARALTVLWLVACVPAAFLILMGHAFNSSKLTPLISVPLWVLTGLPIVWFPVLVRAIFRIRPI